MPVLG